MSRQLMFWQTDTVIQNVTFVCKKIRAKLR
jgi:hypothetical protein